MNSGKKSARMYFFHVFFFFFFFLKTHWSCFFKNSHGLINSPRSVTTAYMSTLQLCTPQFCSFMRQTKTRPRWKVHLCADVVPKALF